MSRRRAYARCARAYTRKKRKRKFCFADEWMGRLCSYMMMKGESIQYNVTHLMINNKANLYTFGFGLCRTSNGEMTAAAAEWPPQGNHKDSANHELSIINYTRSTWHHSIHNTRSQRSTFTSTNGRTQGIGRKKERKKQKSRFQSLNERTTATTTKKRRRQRRRRRISFFAFQINFGFFGFQIFRIVSRTTFFAGVR